MTLCIIIIACLKYLTGKSDFIGFLFESFFYPFFAGGYIVSAKLLQKQGSVFSDFFLGFQYWPLFIFGFIMGLLDSIGYLFHGSPVFEVVWETMTIVINIFYIFTPIIIFDRRLRLWPAMELSRRMVQRQPSMIFIFVFWGFLIIITGILALGVGILVALPVVSGATTAAYADLFGLQSKRY
ncbi:MAG: hypothetical protein M1438_07455 [Deltaproteobacteria bacterium]|nr:hypothetical protein [Deltaproteobacteria bacterium]